MIDKLEYLLALAQERHFGRAADACAVSQPSLSLGLKQLEEALGVMLVQRGSRFIGLTAEGERTLEWARRIVGDARAMRQDIKALKSGLTGQLRIAVIPAALPMVATVTAPLFKRYPDVNFTVLSRPSTEIIPMLDNIEIDAAITYLDAEPVSRVLAIPLYRERYQLLCTKDWPLAKRAKTTVENQVKNNVTWAEVSELPLCLLTRNTQNRRMIEALLRGGGSPRISLESDSMAVLFAHVRTGAWASVVPEMLLKATHLSKEFAAIPIVEPEIVHTIGLVMPLRDPTTPLATALVAEARRAAAYLMGSDRSLPTPPSLRQTQPA
jgi:DNA-binding transcriptional LysR family regulator